MIWTVPLFKLSVMDLLTSRLCVMKQRAEAENLLYLVWLPSIHFIYVCVYLSFKKTPLNKKVYIWVSCWIIISVSLTRLTLKPMCIFPSMIFHITAHVLPLHLPVALQALLPVQPMADPARYSCAQWYLCKVIIIFPCFMRLVPWLLLTSFLPSRLPKQSTFSFWLVSPSVL